MNTATAIKERNQTQNKPSNAEQRMWVTLVKAHEIFGYTPAAFRGKIHRGELIQGKHWRKAPDKKVLINPWAFNEWLESAQQH